MNRLIRLLAGLGIGAAGMYFFDPQQGKRRRALLRDQWIHYKTQLPKQVDRKMRHLQNQAQGAMHELQSTFSSDDASPRAEQGSDNQPMEKSQSDRMQSASRSPSASSGDQYFSERVSSSPSEGGKKGAGPGEAGQRAPSRQPNPRTTMDL